MIDRFTVRWWSVQGRAEERHFERLAEAFLFATDHQRAGSSWVLLLAMIEGTEVELQSWGLKPLAPVKDFKSAPQPKPFAAPAEEAVEAEGQAGEVVSVFHPGTSSDAVRKAIEAWLLGHGLEVPPGLKVRLPSVPMPVRGVTEGVVGPDGVSRAHSFTCAYCGRQTVFECPLPESQHALCPDCNLPERKGATVSKIHEAIEHVEAAWKCMELLDTESTSSRHSEIHRKAVMKALATAITTLEVMDQGSGREGHERL